MGLKDLFKKKKEPDYDATDIRVTDIKLGFIFEYDLSTWEVVEEYEYDWGNNYFSKEFKIFNGTETKFLSLDEDDELYIAVTTKVKVRSVDEDLPEYIIEHEAPPKKITYNGTKFFQEEESPGYFRNVEDGEDDDAWSEVVSWEYEDDNDQVLTIEQWGDKEFEASFGKYIKEYEISNILPKS